MMTPSVKPKVLLFDMGGVCVCSPFQAILDYELENRIPPGWINHSISHSKPNGYWQRLERGEHPLNAAWFTGWHTDLHQAPLWRTYYSTLHPNKPIPAMPDINVEVLFWAMIEYSRSPDPWMFPALQALKKNGEFMLVALSNTLPLPEPSSTLPTTSPTSSSTPSSSPKQGESFNSPTSSPLHHLFDIFIASDAIGLRKPSPEIYSYTLSTINAFRRKESGKKRGREWAFDAREPIKAEEVLFLDDIGENLKGGRKAGFQTFRVILGRTYEAVDQLEAATGLELAGTCPRVPVLAGASLKGKKVEAKL